MREVMLVDRRREKNPPFEVPEHGHFVPLVWVYIAPTMAQAVPTRRFAYSSDCCDDPVVPIVTRTARSATTEE